MITHTYAEIDVPSESGTIVQKFRLVPETICLTTHTSPNSHQIEFESKFVN